MQKGREVRGHAAAAHSSNDARADATRNLAEIYRRSHRQNPRRDSRHRLAHDVHRWLSRGDRRIFPNVAELYSQHKIRTPWRIHLFARGRHAGWFDVEPNT